jgi:DHA2 family multidrug resistance protein
MTNVYAAVDFHTLMMWRVYQAVATAFLFVPVNTLAYSDMPPGASNQVSAMVNLMRNMGGSIGISLVTTMLARRQQVHQAYLTRNAYQDNPLLRQALSQMTNRFATRTDPVQAAHQAQAQFYLATQRQAAILSYIDCYWLLGTLALLSIGLVYIAKKTKPGQAAMH